MNVRVRIAPSPTGLLHIGNARSALFNWLFARHHGGVFILRIDDTDQARSERQYEDDILSGFSWLGLDWDEGIEVGGLHGSYRQSDRLDRYRSVATDLVERGLAYYDFRSSEELDRLRTTAQKSGRAPAALIRNPGGSLDEARRRIDSGEKAVVRMDIDVSKSIEFVDLVRGEMRFEGDAVDDFVVLRSDGSPTYHLASSVDDVDYEISHVARGEDLLSSTPKHIILTEAMGAAPRTYAHLPLLFGPDGKKLSKRHGDNSVKAYREQGFLPDALFNYMSLLGWSLDADTTIFTRDEAVAAFDFGDVSKNPAVFDTEKLSWMNGMYLRAMDPAEFEAQAVSAVEDDVGRDLEGDERAVLAEMLPLVQERVKFTSEIAGQVRFLFVGEVDYDERSWNKTMKADAPRALAASIDGLQDLGDWSISAIERVLRAMLEAEDLNARKGLQPIRVAITGSNVSPPLFESLAALGAEQSIGRLRAALDRLDADPD
ncbi:MAG TPA: glutamate--tRNA ligase [Actinobacteria bacterium]|nr:glutamate--tRNA ligase [Actinomycetota bacterium]